MMLERKVAVGKQSRGKWERRKLRKHQESRIQRARDAAAALPANTCLVSIPATIASKVGDKLVSRIPGDTKPVVRRRPLLIQPETRIEVPR